MELRRVDPEEAQSLLDGDEGYVYLDVRTEEEFREGHPPGAVNIPIAVRNPQGPGILPNDEFLAQVVERFAKDSKIITACHRGPRSMKAAGELIANGYDQVIDMRGGYDGELDPTGAVVFPGWARRGLPTTTE
jgi:rhodanese-related sulfurtransferase